MRLLLLLTLSLCAYAQTRIVDTLKTPFGENWTGKIQIDCPSAVNATGQTIRRDLKLLTITDGVVDVTIDPGDAGSPTGRYCAVRYFPARGSAWTATWNVPTSASPLKVGDVESAGPLPATGYPVPAGSDLTGDYRTGPTVATVGGASAADVADAASKRHVAVTAGDGITVAGQVVTNSDKGTTARTAHEAANAHPWTDDGSTVSAPAGRNVAISTTLLGHGGPTAIADWCVSSVWGDDANDGKCDQYGMRPFRTIAKLQAQTITAGQTIALMAGSVWREQLTVPAHNVTVFAWGQGAKPLLDASDPINASAWSATGGTASVYQATVPVDELASKTWVSAWAGGTRLTRATSTANCDATAGSYYPSADVGQASITLYVHLADGSNPGTKTDGHVEYSKRQYGLDSRAVTGATIYGVWTRRNLHEDGSLVLGKSGTAIAVLATEGNKHNALIRTGTTVAASEFRDAYYGGTQGSLLVFNEDAPAGENVTIDGVYVHNTAFASLVTGINGHPNLSGTFGTVTIKNTRVDNCGYGISGTDAKILWDNVTVTNATTSALVSVQVTAATPDYWITNSHLTSTSRAISIETANASVTIRNSTLATDGGAGDLLIYSGSNGAHVDVADSTLGPAQNDFHITGTGVVITAARNTFNASAMFYKLTQAGYSITSDNNSFGPNAGTGNRVSLGGTDMTFAAYKTLTGQDAHSTTP